MNARLVWEPHRVVPSYAVPVADIHAPLIEPRAVAPMPPPRPWLDPGNAFAIHTTSGSAWTIPTRGDPLVDAAFTTDDADLTGFAIIDWAAFDEWLEEEVTVFGHPHDPFQRIDCLMSDRHVVVSVGDRVLADSRRPTLLLETHLPTRYYLPRADVNMDLLEPSPTHTVCAYKGQASYFSARIGDELIRDAAWTYPHPLHDGAPVRDLLCFYDDRVTVTVG
ncbi:MULTISPECIES: DUF427 domain-containing protein [unclassified Microbacterium]|uniref:DUF427 domain-containing protein n=1 Tax=unclassified Microbacterium TaxID=2609290 RepID=UPI00214B5FDF|nr:MULTISPECIES: DUF427 domain-containing protein [unclassified Microbacterium]MCR2784561.1 DUF427 domain-containing protein [Microbacterium sp. zg.B96]WIM14629.1 DUF427 domain-containing protein [Microbacterium sp. zg-B96]